MDSEGKVTDNSCPLPPLEPSSWVTLVSSPTPYPCACLKVGAERVEALLTQLEICASQSYVLDGFKRRDPGFRQPTHPYTDSVFCLL